MGQRTPRRVALLKSSRGRACRRCAAQMWVGIDGSGNRPAWHPELISVTDMSSQVIYWFDANMWFSARHDDGLTERVLPALSQQPLIRRTVPYQVGGGRWGRGSPARGIWRAERMCSWQRFSNR
eukprot:365358-Chlamydomonas_euryale.AAC.6